eukprot:COSAG06_NODE_44_length_29699_cov_231.744527_22_plen_94_part_00
MFKVETKKKRFRFAPVTRLHVLLRHVALHQTATQSFSCGQRWQSIKTGSGQACDSIVLSMIGFCERWNLVPGFEHLRTAALCNDDNKGQCSPR